MSPAEAAEMHKLWTGQVPASVKIGSPAVARGGQKWMDVSPCAIWVPVLLCDQKDRGTS